MRPSGGCGLRETQITDTAQYSWTRVDFAVTPAGASTFPLTQSVPGHLRRDRQPTATPPAPAWLFFSKVTRAAELSLGSPLKFPQSPRL